MSFTKVGAVVTRSLEPKGLRTKRPIFAVANSKKVSKRKLRKALKAQLGYLRRNLSHIDQLSRSMSLTQLCRGLYRDLLVISEMYRQQQWMHDQRSRRIDDRIVSISHAHFRPAKRGMAGSDVEFCHKVSVSLVDGNRFVDRINWDDFKECQDLQGRWKSTRGV